MELYYESKNNIELLLESDDIKAVFKAMWSFLNKIDFKSYYSRYMPLDDTTVKIDYGSHTDFFIIRNCNLSHFFNEGNDD